MGEVFTHDLLAYDGLKILQKDDVFKFSLDSLLLADFVEITPRNKKILELGCGLGPVLLYLSLKTKINIYGVDIQKEVLELTKKSIEMNELESQIQVMNVDIKEVHKYFEPSSFDIVVANPPFFKISELNQVNKLDALSLARHEVSINFLEIVEATKKMLKTHGSFCFIHRANRLEEIVIVLQKMRFVIKRLRFVYTKPENGALMVLIDARYNGKTGSLRVLEPLYIYNEEGKYTDEVLRIFHLGDDCY